MFIWRFELKVPGSEQVCDGRFLWHMKRVGKKLAVWDPLDCAPIQGKLQQLYTGLTRLQKQFNDRWLELVGPVGH